MPATATHLSPLRMRLPPSTYADIEPPLPDVFDTDFNNTTTTQPRYHFYAQASLADDELLGLLVVGGKLGEGGSGTVYACRLMPSNRRFTLKIPTKLLEQDDVRITASGTVVAAREEDRVLASGPFVKDATHEFRMAEFAMETPIMRDLAGGTGQPVRHMAPWQYSTHLAQQARMRAHPGFEHLLRMVHFCASVPLLLMEACDRSAKAMFDRHELYDEPLRTTFAVHVLHAIEYLRDVAGIANTDIKFGNVMLRRRPQKTFVLIDYGGCVLLNDTTATQTTWTNGFCASEPTWRDADPLALSLYAYTATLLYVFCPDCHPSRYEEDCAIQVRRRAPSPHYLAAEDPLRPIIEFLLRATPSSVPTYFRAVRARLLPPP